MSGAAPVAAQGDPSSKQQPRRQFVWTFADQALSSLTNAAPAVIVARSVGSSQFGAFAIALLTYSFVVGLVRAFVGTPFVVRLSSAEPAERRRRTADAAGAAVVLGVAAGVVCLLAGLAVGGVAGSALAGLGLAMPGLMLQDTWRFTFFAAGRPAAATANDLTWAVVQLGLLVAVLEWTSDSVFLVTLAWGLSAAAAAVVGMVQTGVVPAPRASLSWLRDTRDLSVELGLGFVLNMGAINLVFYVIGGINGLAALGALRAAQTVLGPLNLLFAGLSAFLLPRMSRAATAGRRLVGAAAVGSAVAAVGATTWVAILVLLPDRLGVEILGQSWAVASTVMLPSGLLLIAAALVIGVSNAVVALGRTDLMLRLTTVQAVLMLVLGVAGALLDGVVAAAYGMALAQFIGMLGLWWLLVRAEESRPAPTTG